MALTYEEKQELFSILNMTGGHREVALKQRVIPEGYQAYLEQVTQEEIVLSLPGTALPVRCVLTIANNRLENCPVHINMHGGGFIFKQDHDDDLYCAHLAAGIHGIVVDIDYATSDEHPYPAGFDQCYAVAGWVFEKCAEWSADPARVSIGGASAGGELALAVSLKAGETGDFRFCLQILDYAANDSFSPVGDPKQLRSEAFSRLYCDGDLDVLKHPYVSPVFASDAQLAKLPRTLFVHAENCPFTACNRLLADRMIDQGIEVTSALFKGSNHGFTVRMVGAWEEAQNLIIRTINVSSL